MRNEGEMEGGMSYRALNGSLANSILLRSFSTLCFSLKLGRKSNPDFYFS